MPRSIIVSYHGHDSEFGFKKLNRGKLYGRRLRIVLDPAGEPCERAELTDDGSTLLRVGMTAQGYFDPDQRWIPSRDLVGLDEDGNPVEAIPSTLGRSQTLEGPIAPEEVLDVQVKSVYLLDPVELTDDLREALDSGQLFRFPFNYRTDYHADVGILLANEDGAFALVGNPVESEWCQLAQAGPQDFSDEDDIDADLDFEMF